MKKIGRNEPCPCGSGKKFKHCHLGREGELETASMNEFTVEMSGSITALPPVDYGRSREMLEALDIKGLTGSSMGIVFVDLKGYMDLDAGAGKTSVVPGKNEGGGVVINFLKTQKKDPNHIYVAISPDVSDSTLIHQLAHVLNYLGGSGQMPGLAKPLSFDLGVPTDHLEHPHEFGYWLDYLQKRFAVVLDAEDAIISFLYSNGLLIKGQELENRNSTLLKSKSERMLRFLSEKSGEIDAMIRDLPGYIGPRKGDGSG
jgi:hypothetical protein